MKLRKFGQAVLTTVVGVGLSFGLTSCVQSHTVGYFFVTGHQYSNVASYKIDNNTGNLTQVSGSPYSSGGSNPVDALVTPGGRFLYVLNAGCADPAVYPNAKYPCASTGQPTSSSVSVFTIGGGGALSFQQSYTSVGNNSVAITTDSTGGYLYVLDQNAPTSQNTPLQYQSGGDVSVYQLDSTTGRLSLIQNQQVKDVNGNPLNFFPVGQDPVWFTTFNTNLFTIDRAAGQTTNASFVSVYATSSSTGQLTATQNSEFPTGATNLTYIYGKGSYIYLLDAGDPTQTGNPTLYNGSILTYTAGSNGALASITGGVQSQAALGYSNAVYPDAMVVESSTSKYVYVANRGLNTGLSAPASIISQYQITPTNGVLTSVGGVNNGSVNVGTGSGPRCVLEDPSNQFLYTANYNDSTISGFVINTETGNLTTQRKKTTFAGPGNPTWCTASGTTF